MKTKQQTPNFSDLTALEITNKLLDFYQSKQQTPFVQNKIKNLKQTRFLIKYVLKNPNL